VIGLGVLDRQADAETLEQRVKRGVEQIIAPALANDGGRLEILDLDSECGELRVRLVGSCADCPYSLLSMEQIVVPGVMAIPGMVSVRHRVKPRNSEIPAAVPPADVIPLVSDPQFIPDRPAGPCVDSTQSQPC
jgi:Fe-S cluster biogenesis protein NfuA